MQLSIRSRGFKLTEALSAHITKRFQSALRNASRRIQEVTVRLRDINGSTRGGVDKHCQVELRLADGGTMVIRETDANMYTAIDRAAGRSKRNVLERLGARVTRRRARRARREDP